MPALADLPQFLADWSSDHRPMTDAHRSAVGSYIMAILARDSKLAEDGQDAVREEARRLWVLFRTTYDALRGAYQRSEAEDVRRAMSQL